MARFLVVLTALAMLATFGGRALAQAAKPVSVQGAWQVSMDGHGTAVMQTLALQQKGGAITGTLKAPQGNAVPVSGTVSGQNVSFSVKRHTTDGDVTQEFVGTVSGDAIKGTVTQGQYHVGWTAARSKARPAP